MSNEIKNLEPKVLWENFYSLTQIPRPSNHEARIQDFIYDFGKNLGLETIKDEVGNIIVKKPATPGLENCRGVIMQGHLDMVPQKNSDKDHDFENDPIEAFVDGDWVTANGTTLGADNGIGVAATMAVLASKSIEHGPFEALFTATEETGMDGAEGLKAGVMDGDILINTDTEDDGTFSVGCAGGIDVISTFKTRYKKLKAKNNKAFKLSITGLKGGHSGVDIHLGRGNANKIFFRILNELNRRVKVSLADIQGGSLRNAIPREAFGVLVLKEASVEKLNEKLGKIGEVIKAELINVEPDLSIAIEETEMPEVIFEKDFQQKLTNAIWAAPNDVVRMSDTMVNTVETSSNLAIVKAGEKSVEISCLVRSFSETAKLALASRIQSVFKLAEAKVVFEGSYPGWKPDMDSSILEVMKNLYADKYGKEPELLAMHAGLECGILGSTYTNWDMISFGPTIRFPHSPDEKVNIETVSKFWDFLLETLKNIPKK